MVFDVVVIGGGPGGYACAIRCAQLGLKTALVEKNSLGGVCANVGCIPTKSLVYSAQLARKISSASAHGIRVEKIELDFASALKRARNAALMVSKGVELLLKSNGIELIKGVAAVESPNLVRVADRLLQAKNIVIATGGAPASFPGVGFSESVVSGEQVIGLTKSPKTAVIIGGGVEGVEFASIMASFGIQVTLVEAMNRVISLTDEEASELVAKSLGGLGVRLMTGARVEKIDGNAVLVNGEKISADLIIVVIGKRPNVGEDVKKLGVQVSKAGIAVDSGMQTCVKGVYAIGDVVGGGLAHVASEQGVVCAQNIAGLSSNYDASVVPCCIFSSPQVACVGDVSGNDATIGVFPFAALGMAAASGERTGFVKVFVKESIIVGAVIVGEHASDLIAEATLAVKLKASAESVCETIHAHPTFSEAFLEAVKSAVGKSIHLPKK